MIEVNVTYKENMAQLKITGHAGYADPGKDIVCLAASVLLHTLLENIDPNRCIVNKIEKGDADIVISGKYQVEKMDMFLKGYMILEKEYPDYVHVIW